MEDVESLNGCAFMKPRMIMLYAWKKFLCSVLQQSLDFPTISKQFCLLEYYATNPTDGLRAAFHSQYL